MIDGVEIAGSKFRGKVSVGPWGAEEPKFSWTILPNSGPAVRL
jgi:hypothetical protein